MQGREVVRESLTDLLRHDNHPRMGTFMHHLHEFLHRNGVVMVHGSTLYEFGYIDQENQRGLYYTASDREHHPHKTWVFERQYGSKRTQVHLVDDYTGERVPVQIFGKQHLAEAIKVAEENLVRAQASMIKSPLDHH